VAAAARLPLPTFALHIPGCRRRGCGRAEPLVPFTSVERFPAPSSRHGGITAASGRSACVSIEIAIAEIARSGYPEATSTD
jgi:hypothetical protein